MTNPKAPLPDDDAAVKALDGLSRYFGPYNGEIEWVNTLRAYIASQAAEIERCHVRLEIDHHFVALNDTHPVRVDIPLAEREKFPDGIDCRNETIKLQDKRIAELEAENNRLLGLFKTLQTNSVLSEHQSLIVNEALAQTEQKS